MRFVVFDLIKFSVFCILVLVWILKFVNSFWDLFIDKVIVGNGFFVFIVYYD